MLKITHKGGEVEEFFKTYMHNDRHLLMIGTVGFNNAGNYFPSVLANYQNVDYKFFLEERTIVPKVVLDMGKRNQDELTQQLKNHFVEFVPVQVVAEDSAPVAGRNATKLTRKWITTKKYTDIVVDVTSMSRGICFSVVRQVVEYCHANSIEPHILVAERDLSGVKIQPMSSDIACYMHGFQEDMETDLVDDALVMWIPQLSENAMSSLDNIYTSIKPSEVCPALPFPAIYPRRADELLLKFRQQLVQWEVELYDTIYAHESDPLDVCETIGRIHRTRKSVLECSVNTPVRTVLSPTGWRIGSIGMLLAAMENSLPVIYTENIGYTAGNIDDEILPTPSTYVPPNRWHIWMRCSN